MRRHALFVGVDEYTDPSIKNLNFSSEDARDLASVFRHQLHFDRVAKLTNPAHASDVVDMVKNLTHELSAGDLFLFFFAGHGFRVNNEHVLVCAKDEYAELEDVYTGLPIGRLKKRMRGPWNRMLVLDTCQNDIRATRGADAGVQARDIELIHAQENADSESGYQVILTACSEGQKALEVSSLGHGLFTSAFLGSVTAFADSRKRLDIETLRTDLGERMRKLIIDNQLSGKQDPLFTFPIDAKNIVLLDGEVSGGPSADGSGVTMSNLPTKDTSSPKLAPQYKRKISNWIVGLDWNMPGCDEKKLTFTLFETLSRFLFFLQGLGTHGESGSEMAFGSEPFRTSVWAALSSTDNEVEIAGPPLTEEDVAAICDGGGMEKLARRKQILSIYKELNAELELLKVELLKNCKGNDLAKHARLLVADLSKCMQIKDRK